MKNCFNFLSLLLLVTTISLSAKHQEKDLTNQLIHESSIEIASENLFIPSSLEGIHLYHTKDGFFIMQDGNKFPVKNSYVDEELRNLSNHDLEVLLGIKTKIKINDQDCVFTKVLDKDQVLHFIMEEEICLQGQESDQLSEKNIEKIVSQLSQVGDYSGYIKVIQYSDGEYGLQFNARLLGGGSFGAMCGAYAGKFIVHLIFHGTVVAVSSCFTAGAGPIAASLEITFLPTVEAISTVAALAGGILGGAITGPV